MLQFHRHPKLAIVLDDIAGADFIAVDFHAGHLNQIDLRSDSMASPSGKPLFAVLHVEQAVENSVEFLDRRRRAFCVLPNASRSGDEIGTRLDEWRGIVRRDAANSDARQFDEFLPEAQNIGCGLGFGLLGAGLVKSPESNIISPRFAGFHSEMPAVMAGDAEDGIVADKGAGVFCRHIILADMHAVAAEFGGQSGVVVQNKSNIMPVYYRHELRYRRGNFCPIGRHVIRRFET